MLTTNKVGSVISCPVPEGHISKLSSETVLLCGTSAPLIHPFFFLIFEK